MLNPILPLRIVKLGATDSTNAYLRELMSSEPLADMTTVVARAQKAGRGQLGAQWTSEPGKNLLVSVLKKNGTLSAQQQFYLNIAVSLAVLDTLKKRQVPDLAIKWPNDILSGNAKICGILIENIISGPMIKTSIIGIGLNVNQTKFANLPNASSLKLLLGIDFDLDVLLQDFLQNLQMVFESLDPQGITGLKRRYLEHLFMKDRPARFQIADAPIFHGIIRGVTEAGRLMVTHQTNGLMEYDLKEVKLLY